MERKQSQFTAVESLDEKDFIPAFGQSTNKKISKPDLFKQIKEETQIFIYPTIEQLQSANLIADSDWPIYVRVEETEYKLYKITTLAAGVDDITLINGNTASLQDEYASGGGITSLSDGSITAPSLNFTASPTVGIYRSPSNGVGIVTGTGRGIKFSGALNACLVGVETPSAGTTPTSILITAGSPNAADPTFNAARVSLAAGSTTGSGLGGNVAISGGSSVSGNGGGVNIVAGSSTNGRGGDTVVEGGSVVVNTSSTLLAGDVIIRGGGHANTPANRGKVILTSNGTNTTEFTPDGNVKFTHPVVEVTGVVSSSTPPTDSAHLTNKSYVDVTINSKTWDAAAIVSGIFSDERLPSILDSKTLTGVTTLPSTTSIGTVSSTEISYLDGVTSNIQSQLNGKLSSSPVLANTTASFTTSLEAKLNGIAPGAEVNVNADWDAISGDAQILNKPSFSAIATTGNAGDLISGVLPAARLSGTYNITNSGSSATLTTGRTISSTGDVVWTSGAFNGSANVTGVATLSSTGVGAGTYGSDTQTSTVVVDAKGRITGATNTPIRSATTTQTGLVQLEDSLSSSSVLLAPTANALRVAYQSLSTSLSLKQNALGYTPVQQGTGIGQTSNDVSIGWSVGGELKATVDSTDLGAFAFKSFSSNASNLSSGTVDAARLPSASLSAIGIVQLSSSVSSTSTTFAATPSAVKDAYDLAVVANGTANSFGSVFSAYRASPSQAFQNLGTVSGTVSVNGSSGIHVLATVNGNTTWSFPVPSSDQAHAITLELTNGGAYVMTWPVGMRWSGGVAPTLTASGTDILVFTKAGNNPWRGYLSSKDNK